MITARGSWGKMICSTDARARALLLLSLRRETWGGARVPPRSPLCLSRRPPLLLRLRTTCPASQIEKQLRDEKKRNGPKRVKRRGEGEREKGGWGRFGMDLVWSQGTRRHRPIKIISGTEIGQWFVKSRAPDLRPPLSCFASLWPS